MAIFTSQYPIQDEDHVKATTINSDPYQPHYATDPTKSLTGNSFLNQWFSSFAINQRFHIDLGSAKVIRRIYYENSHHIGQATDYGVKNFTFWGSNTAASFAELTYGINTGWTQITPAQSTFDEHIEADQADPKYITVKNDIGYRYYALKFAGNWGYANYMGVRRIELQTFTGDPPTTTIQAISDIEEITAIGNGNITNTGGINCTKRGICWDTSPNPDVNDSKSEEIGNFGTGAFTRPMTGLIRGEKYYVKAYAYNPAGYGYSSQVDFYTYPAVTTYAPTDIIRADPTTVTANGLIELDVAENITTRGFKYGLTEADTWNNSETGTYSEGAFSLTLTGLTADTTYYIRAYAIGAWGTKYGSYLQFKTAYPYGANKVEIKSEATASAADIALVGGKRSLTIENHLIQNQTIADLISAAYLADYKDQKTKLVVTRPCPAPFEIGDTILKEGSTEIPYCAAASAVVSYAVAVDGLYYYGLASRNVLIRKINVSFSAGNYVSVLELED